MIPLYWLVNTTFKFKVQIQSDLPVWLPHPPTHVVAASVIFSVIFGPLMAYSLSRFPSRYNKQIENWIISTRMMLPAALIMPFYFLFLRVHLLNMQLARRVG
jgi:ABC-type glycerol-3-phosphate transport system permease component